MARRTHQFSKKRLKVVVASGEVAVKGQRAHGNTANGQVHADPAGLTTLIPLGYFTEDMTGDGVKTTVVMLFEEIHVHGWANDSAPNDVGASDIFNEVYASDQTTVSTLATGRSVAGRVYFIDDDGRVYVRSTL